PTIFSRGASVDRDPAGPNKAAEGVSRIFGARSTQRSALGRQSGLTAPPHSSSEPDIPERQRSDRRIADNGADDEVIRNRQDEDEQYRQRSVRQESKSPDEGHDRHPALEKAVVAQRFHPFQLGALGTRQESPHQLVHQGPADGGRTEKDESDNDRHEPFAQLEQTHRPAAQISQKRKRDPEEHEKRKRIGPAMANKLGNAPKRRRCGRRDQGVHVAKIVVGQPIDREGKRDVDDDLPCKPEQGFKLHGDDSARARHSSPPSAYKTCPVICEFSPLTHHARIAAASSARPGKAPRSGTIPPAAARALGSESTYAAAGMS